MRKWILGLLSLSLIAGCEHYSGHKAHLKLKKTISGMTTKLKKIHSKEDLILQAQDLKGDFEQLAKDLIMIKQLALTQERFLSLKKDHVHLNFEAEIDRIQALDGCLKILQNLSIDGLYLIDAFERKLENPKLHQVRSKMVVEN